MSDRLLSCRMCGVVAGAKADTWEELGPSHWYCEVCKAIFHWPLSQEERSVIRARLLQGVPPEQWHVNLVRLLHRYEATVLHAEKEVKQP